MATHVLDYAASLVAGPDQVGGKGWNLARMARYGFPVPAGGVLRADVYRRLLARDRFQERLARFAGCSAEDAGDPEVREALAHFADAIRADPLPAEVVDDIQRFLADRHLESTPLAVRSSATNEDGIDTSFAGIHTSTLNVVGSASIVQAMLDCFASLWTPQALAYRRRMDIADRDAACAVVLCAMIGGPAGVPAAAGVAFSCDPRTGRRDIITINAAAGLGDAVVHGDVTPDEYVVEAHAPHSVVARSENGAPLLDNARLAELGRLVWRVHWALGEGQDPQDIEWAYDGRRFWLLQARPVTRLPHATFPDRAADRAIWSNANVKDSFPNPATMITWSMMESVVRSVLFASLNLVRFPLPPGMEVMRRFAGRFYFDLAIIQWAMYDAIGITPAETNRTTGGFQPEITVPAGNPMGGRAGLRRAWRRLIMLWGLARFRRQLPSAIDEVFRENRRGRAMDLHAACDAELLDELRRRVAMGNRFTPGIQLAAAYYGAWMTVLQDVLGRLTGDRQQSLVTRLLAASGSVASAEHGYRLIDLATIVRDEPAAGAAIASDDCHAWRHLGDQSAFRRAFARYLDDYGHRGVYEMDFGSPRWRDDPTYLLQQIRGLVALEPNADPRQRATQVRLEAERELHRLPWLARPFVRWMLAKTRRGASLRESAKSAAAASVELIRHALLEAGRRMVERRQLREPDDICHLAMADVEAYLSGAWSGEGAAALVDDRKHALARWWPEIPPGVVMDGHSPPADPAPARNAACGEPRNSPKWTGVAAAPGIAEGPVSVVEKPQDGVRLAAGDVLVAPSTDPAWTPLFLRASAIVMETGGYLSHGAIVAREFGLPSVVNIPGIMTGVASGDRLRVNGDTGEVWLLRHASVSSSEAASVPRMPPS
jgi:pyruvate,water dikinase